MKTLSENIKSNLSEGFELTDAIESKSSKYFYIKNKDGVELKARISNHDAMTGRSLSHVQVLFDNLLHIDFDFEPIFDEDDYEVELTKEDAVKQINNHFGTELTADQIWEANEYNCSLDAMKIDYKKIEKIIGKYIAEKITEVEATMLY